MKRILVIDDDTQLGALVGLTLSKAGYEVSAATDSRQAIELALAERPDLILSDIGLMGANGLDLMRLLRERKETTLIPVVLMTGQSQPGLRFSMEKGADDYLPKPFTMEQMLSAVQARLQRQEEILRVVEQQQNLERITAEEKLNLLTSALESAANGVVITQSGGKIVWVNRAFTELTGYSSVEVYGQNLRFLKSGQHAESFYAELWQTILRGEVWQGEMINRRKDGKLYYEEQTITPVRQSDGKLKNFIAIKRDVSERKRIEAVLARERDLLQSLMDNQPDHIYFKDAASHYLRINRAYATFLGLDQPEAALGRTDQEFFSIRESRQKQVDEHRIISTGEPMLASVEKTELRGQEKWFSTIKVLIRNQRGEVEGLVGISRDITSQKRSENELRWKTAFLEALVNSAIDGILVVDPAAMKLLLNQRLIDIFKIPPEIAAQKSNIRQLDWIYQRVKHPEKFIEKVAYLNARQHEVSQDEIELLDGTTLDRYSSPVISENGQYYGRIWTFRDITGRKQAEERLRLLQSAVEQANDSIIITDAQLDQPGPRISFVNPAFSEMTGYSEAEVLGRTPRILQGPRTDRGVLDRLRRNLELGFGFAGETINYRKDGTEYHQEWQIAPISDTQGKVTHFIAIQRNISERKRQEIQSIQSQKLETVGQLAAGIAHEINTPTQYVGDNTRFVKESFDVIVNILRSHEKLLAAVQNNQVTPEMVQNCQELLASSDLEYLYDQIPAAIKETLEGVERVSKIVRAMKEFSHPGGRGKTPSDLNKAIESTVTVARNEWKYIADLRLELAPNLPLVPCSLGEFNQCILNLLVNAAHAIADVIADNPGEKGVITIQTRPDGDFVEIRVIDTGTGIPESARAKIFEPFFTTKDVGRGTGQGLTQVYACIVKRHGGSVTFQTEIGQGSTFIMRLPLKAKIISDEKSLPTPTQARP